MGTDNRDQKRHLIHQLLAEAGKFDFFEAVRRLEQVNRDKPRIGNASRPSEEPVRFGQEPTLAFPPTSISDFQTNTGSSAVKLIVYFLGLLGPNGPMPLQFTEQVRMRTLNNLDPTLQRFLDVFHHRLISLFYKAWSLNEQAVSYDRQDDDWFSKYVGNLIGVALRDTLSDNEVPVYAKLYWSGRFISNARNADGLQAILTDFFEIPVEIEEFVGTWMPIPKQYYCALGEKRENASIGVNAVLGSSVYTKTEKFKIILGPLDLENFERMLPGQPSFARLKDWVNSYLAKPLLWEIQFILKAENVPRAKLGCYGQLGATAWIRSQEMSKNSCDPIIQSTTRIRQFIKKQSA